jgi:hypothetical protein
MWKVADTEYTEWQRPLYVVHSIMMKKLAQAGEGVEGVRPPPFTIPTITYKVLVYALGRADTLPLFLLYLYPLYVLYGGRGPGSVLV